MKKIILILLVSNHCFSQVVRSQNSDINEFKQYLQNSQNLSFVESFDQARKNNLEAYEMAGPSEFLELLKTAPLPSSARELWYSQIAKSENSSRRLESLLLIDPELEKVFMKKHSKFKGNDLKHKILAWLKLQSPDSRFWVDGLSIEQTHIIDDGTHQFVLASNHYLPIVYFGSWNEFSKLEKKLFVTNDCKNPNPDSSEKWQLGFFDSSCIYAKNLSQNFSVSSTNDSLNENNNSWLWPTIIAVGAGLAIGLKDKKVSVKMPSFNFR